MNQSQEFKKSDPAVLRKAERENVYGNEELSAGNTSRQIRRGALEEAAYTAFDAMEHHKTFQKQQKSYNEVREQYEEQAFSSGTPPIETASSGSSAGPSGNQPPPEFVSGDIGDKQSGEVSGSFAGGFNGTSTGENGGWRSPTMQEVDYAGSYGSLTFGTAEASRLARNSQALSENEKLQEKLEGRRKDVQKAYTRFSAGKYSTKEKELFRYYGRLNLTGAGETELAHFGRLKYSGRIARVKMNRDDYGRLLGRQSKKSFRRRTGRRLLFHGVKTAVDDEILPEDELTGSMKRSIRRAERGLMIVTRRNIRTVKEQNSVYARLDQAKQRSQVLQDKRARLMSDARRKQQKAEIRAAQSRAQKKKLKKQMVQMRVREKGHFFTRVQQNRLVKRRAKKLRQQVVKRTLSTIFSLGGLALFFLSAWRFLQADRNTIRRP